MAISNCVFSPTSENLHGFSTWCVLATLTANPRNYSQPNRCAVAKKNRHPRNIMGFGFNLFFIFILVPLTGILLIAWLLSRKLWIGIFGLALLSGIVQWLTSKTELDKEDYNGEYVVNRDYFEGEQTDWQYNHFRFCIVTPR